MNDIAYHEWLDELAENSILQQEHDSVADTAQSETEHDSTKTDRTI